MSTMGDSDGGPLAFSGEWPSPGVVLLADVDPGYKPTERHRINIYDDSLLLMRPVKISISGMQADNVSSTADRLVYSLVYVCMRSCLFSMTRRLNRQAGRRAIPTLASRRKPADKHASSVVRKLNSSCYYWDALMPRKMYTRAEWL